MLLSPHTAQAFLRPTTIVDPVTIQIERLEHRKRLIITFFYPQIFIDTMKLPFEYHLVSSILSKLLKDLVVDHLLVPNILLILRVL